MPLNFRIAKDSTNEEVVVEPTSPILEGRSVHKYECMNCHAFVTSEKNKDELQCICGNPNFVLFSSRFNKESLKESSDKFSDPKLMELICEELSKTHLKDDKEKMTLFTCVTTAYQEPKHRQSIALTGDSSVGKDNMQDTVLSHIPEDDYFKLTNATQATLEDDIQSKRIIAYSEMNQHREDGANSHLVEAIKQLTEGGMSALKKDIRKGMKEARHSKTEQKVVIYGTTEAQRDEELETRFLGVAVKADPSKILLVNSNTLNNASDLDKIVNDQENKGRPSWIKIGLTALREKGVRDVLIPYASLLTEKINERPVFDNNNPRSQRDLKRLLNLTRAVAWLHQKQRQIIEYKGHKIIIAEPSDLFYVLDTSFDFFNDSYEGVDVRLLSIIQKMRELDNEDWMERDALEKGLNIAKNTLKDRLAKLSDIGLVEGSPGIELNKIINQGKKLEEWDYIYDARKIYYRRCQKGVKKVLITCQITDIKKLLSNYSYQVPDNNLTRVCQQFDNKKGTESPILNVNDDNVVKYNKNIYDIIEKTDKTGKIEQNIGERHIFPEFDNIEEVEL